MIEGIRPNENNIVLELGVGTGAITKFLQRIVPDEKSYLGIEIDEEFVVKSLKRRFSRTAELFAATPATLREIHQNIGLRKNRYIVSVCRSLPCRMTSSETILWEIDKFMAEGCTVSHVSIRSRLSMPSADQIPREFMEDRYGKSNAARWS